MKNKLFFFLVLLNGFFLFYYHANSQETKNQKKFTEIDNGFPLSWE